jgi:hypothetical protein
MPELFNSRNEGSKFKTRVDYTARATSGSPWPQGITALDVELAINIPVTSMHWFDGRAVQIGSIKPRVEALLVSALETNM